MTSIGIDSFFLSEVLEKRHYFGIIRYNYNLLKYLVFKSTNNFKYNIYHPYPVSENIYQDLNNIFYPNQKINEEDLKHKISFHNIPFNGNRNKWMHSIGKFIKKNGHTIDIFFSPFNVLLKNFDGKKICYVHDIIPLFPLMPQKFKANLKFLKFFSPQDSFFYLKETLRILKNADKIFVPSHATADDLTNFAAIWGLKHKTSNIIVNYQILDDEYFELADKKKRSEIKELNTKYNLPDQYIISIGGTGFRKNNISLLRAYSRLEDKLKKNFPLLLLYDPADNQDFMKIIDNESNIHILGNLPEIDFNLILKEAYALVFPTWYEGFGLPLAEAMALGTPVISTNAGSVPEIVGKGGLLYNPDDENELQSKIQILLTDYRLQQELKQNAKLQVSAFTGSNHKYIFDEIIPHL